MPQRDSFSDWLTHNWLPRAVALCVATGGVTWTVAQSVLIAPRDFEINRLKEQNAALQQELTRAHASVADVPPESAVALPETGVFEHASVTTLDGRCNILIKNVFTSSVSMSVTLDSRPPVDYLVVDIGKRVTIDAGDKRYFIDLHRTRGTIVDMSVQQQRK